MDFASWRKIISQLEAASGDFKLRAAREYQPLDKFGGERHGSWVWTWVGYPNEHDPLTHYVSFAVTEETEPGPNATYLVEISAGADDSRHFHSIVTSRRRYGGYDAVLNDIHALAMHLQRAFITTELFTSDDLVHAYPRAPMQYR